ncbi:MAG TPA: GNAT family protein [Isosphaeraceae bacterium]|jgi:RimJ/RimL family protein N-acetyltransferase|nr:GNAT family protein [Isosphaeraceae bacterium]
MERSTTIETIETPRLVGRRLGPGHIEEVRVLLRDPLVMRTLSADGAPMPEPDIRASLDQADDHWHRHGFGLWAFRARDDGRFVGRGGLKWYEVEGEDVVGVGYAIISPEWGRGHATEIARACLRVGFGRLGLEHIGCWTLPFNHASRRVMEKVGFRYLRDADFAGLPHRIYRITRDDWRDDDES